MRSTLAGWGRWSLILVAAAWFFILIERPVETWRHPGPYPIYDTSMRHGNAVSPILWMGPPTRIGWNPRVPKPPFIIRRGTALGAISIYLFLPNIFISIFALRKYRNCSPLDSGYLWRSRQYKYAKWGGLAMLASPLALIAILSLL